VPLYHTKYCSAGKIELLLPTIRFLSCVEVGVSDNSCAIKGCSALPEKGYKGDDITKMPFFN